MQVERGSVGPSKAFLTFFLLGPAIAAAIQLLLFNVAIGLLSLHNLTGPNGRPDVGWFVVLLLGAMELSAVIEAFLIFVFGLPASLMVAATATLSYFIVKKVSVGVVIAAVVAAVALEWYLARDAYFGYIAWHGVRGPWVPDELDADEGAAIFLVCSLHLVPALTCWWLVRDMRKLHLS
jgi:hypothetical protein